MFEDELEEDAAAERVVRRTRRRGLEADVRQRLNLKGLPPPKLGLNCVAGESGASLANLLGHGGVLVTYGGTSKQPVSVPVGPFIFKDITLRGFWMTRWSQQHSIRSEGRSSRH